MTTETVYLSYHPNQTIAVKAPLKDEQLHGLVQCFDENSSLIQEAHYQSGLLDGLMTLYAENNKQCTIMYSKGLKHGEEKHYTESGQTYLIQNYEYGQLHGRSTWFDMQQRIAKIAHFRQGKLHGKWVTFYPDGQIMEKCYYKDNQPCGTWICYPPNQELQSA